MSDKSKRDKIIDLIDGYLWCTRGSVSLKYGLRRVIP